MEPGLLNMCHGQAALEARFLSALKRVLQGRQQGALACVMGVRTGTPPISRPWRRRLLLSARML